MRQFIILWHVERDVKAGDYYVARMGDTFATETVFDDRDKAIDAARAGIAGPFRYYRTVVLEGLLRPMLEDWTDELKEGDGWPQVLNNQP